MNGETWEEEEDCPPEVILELRNSIMTGSWNRLVPVDD